MQERINEEKEYNTKKDSLYNMVIRVDSMNLLMYEGWKILKAKNELSFDKEKQVAVVSILGNKNSGKSFILHLLTNKKIPNGYSVTTDGLSFIIPDNDKNKDDNYILIDTAGTESPLLFDDDSKNKNNKKEGEEKEKENQKPTIENMLKDRQITDYFIQKFILEKSDIFICVVDILSLTDQKFINRIIKYYSHKKIYIIHNLKTFIEKNQVEEYIRDYLLQSLTFDLEKVKYFDLTKMNKEKEQNCYFYKQKLKDEDRVIIHLIMANEDSPAGEYYNEFATYYLNTQLRQVKEKKPFDIVRNLKDFLINISGEIFKTKLEEKDLAPDENSIKVNIKNLELKDCSIDTLGNSIIKESVFKPKYRYGFFVDKEKKVIKFFIEIELFALWTISQGVSTKDSHFIIEVRGDKVTDIVEREYIDDNFTPGNVFYLTIEVGSDKGFIDENPILDEENGLYTLIYTLRRSNREEEVISEESDDEDF